MNDIFYYFGFIFIVNGIKHLVFFNREFEKQQEILIGGKESMAFAKKILKERKGMGLEELGETKSRLEDLVRAQLNTVDEEVKQNKLSNIIKSIDLIWHIAGVVASNLWILFSLNLIITAVSAICPVFWNVNKKQDKIISLCNILFEMSVICLIEYIHFN